MTRTHSPRACLAPAISRATIERAKGMLMARHDCSEQDAFKILAAAARRQHRKVRLVAGDLVVGIWSAELPAPTG